MLFTRQAYAPEEEWDRLRRVPDAVRAVLERERVLGKLPRSAGLTRMRDRLDELGLEEATRIRGRVFSDFGELGDREVLRPYLLEELPARTPEPLAGLPEAPVNIAASLAMGDEDDERGDRWFLDRRVDHDSVRLRRERIRVHRYYDDRIGEYRTEEIPERADFDIRLDRKRRAIFVSGGSRGAANKLAQAVIANFVGAGLQIGIKPRPTLNIGVIEAAIDSFGAGARLTNISPSDQELQPLRRVGTRHMDLRSHKDVQAWIRLGEQTALSAEFDRQSLGGANTCPARAMIEIDVNWTLAPATYVEPQMLLFLYDRLLEFSDVARLLVPVSKQVELRLRARLGARLTPGREAETLERVVKALRDLGAADRPEEAPGARVFDTAVLGTLLAAADCGRLRSKEAGERLNGDEVERIMTELVPDASDGERSRVRDVLEDLVGAGGGYRGLLERAEKALRGAGC